MLTVATPDAAPCNSKSTDAVPCHAESPEQPSDGLAIQCEQHKSAMATLASFKKPAHWIVALGTALAMCAGIVDVAGFHLFGKLVTHQTGTVAKLAMEVREVHIDDDDWHPLRDYVSILACFMFGAFLCGLLIDKNQVHFGGKSAYGLALVGNALLLVAATYAATFKDSGKSHISGAYFAALASGLQNAMCTSHFGAVVRTTHITGTVTDIGSTSGRMVMILLRKRCRIARLNILEKAELEVDKKKLLVLLPLLLGFFLGCVMGSYLELALHEYALLVPAAFTGIVGFVYMFFRKRLKENLKRLEIMRLTKDLHEADGALARAHRCLTELRHQHHAPESEVEASIKSIKEKEEEKAVVDLDEEVEHALEIVHEMEMTLDELRSEQDHKEQECV